MMTDDTRLAFAHPAERAAATPVGAPLLDRISLRDHVVAVEIGAFQTERGTTQHIRFNVVVEVIPLKGPINDDVDRILSYDRVTEAIAAELAAERLDLLETLAERVADRILLEPQAVRVFVRIEKLDRGPGALGVEIMRLRDAAPADAAIPAMHVSLHPRVVFLNNAVVGDPGFGALVDRLTADETPLILCVGPPDGPLPQAGARLAQRRIDLLAIEQNAWVLAGRDKRCIVTGTRTELDWAMKHGQVCVWAPSKIVLDAVDGPTSVDPRDGLALAAWFAVQMGAVELLVLGGADRRDFPVPVRHATVARPLE